MRPGCLSVSLSVSLCISRSFHVTAAQEKCTQKRYGSGPPKAFINLARRLPSFVGHGRLGLVSLSIGLDSRSDKYPSTPSLS